MSDEYDVGLIASEIVQFAMQKIPPHLKGNQFSKVMIEIFSLCTSETISAAYCKHHFIDALQMNIDLIRNDLGLEGSHER